MSRTARKQSSTNIHHVIIRGINQQQIFGEDSDYLKFSYILSDVKEISEFSLFAYCLMSNHIHLLIQVKKEPLDLIMKRILDRFVHWYNKKYFRCGHLFQDRYLSEPVENKEYFLNVLRYIVQNPMKANIENTPGTYQWTSFHSYFNRYDNLIDSKLISSYFSTHKSLHTFLCQNAKTNCLDYEKKGKKYCTDEYAWNIIKSISNCTNTSEFQKLSIEARNEYLTQIKYSDYPISIRQLSRITGISRYIISKL